MPHVSDILPLVEAFTPDLAPGAIASHDRTLTLLRTTPQPFDRRQFAPGHLTVSGVVLDPSGRSVVIVWHERLGRWLQPGGHFEAEDRGAREAACREVLEETGLTVTVLPGTLVGIDVHAIPAAGGEPDHLHHDLVFAFRLVQQDRLGGGSARAEWCVVEQLEMRGADDALRRAAARAVAVLT